MKDLYEKNEYCMSFTDEEIEEHFVKPIKSNTLLEVELVKSQNNFTSIALTYRPEVFSISFYGHQTSIFISGDDFNEEFMFIDDYTKKDIVSSDTYGNVVYEGILRNKTKKEILELFLEFIKILNGCKKIVIKESVVTQDGFQYPKCNYYIAISNNTTFKGNVEFENITFNISPTN